MKNPKLIIIAGDNGSGKTTISNALYDHLSEKEVILFKMDDYFIPYNKREKPQKLYGDDNSPHSFYLNRLFEDLKNTIKSKMYDYIILEGVLALYSEDINSLTEYRIYVECSEEKRFSRRVQANFELDMTFDDLTNVYLDLARNRSNQFAETSKHNANLIVSGESDLETPLKEILNFIK